MDNLDRLFKPDPRIDAIAAKLDSEKFEKDKSKLTSLVPLDENGSPDYVKFGRELSKTVTCVVKEGSLVPLISNEVILNAIFQFCAEKADSIKKSKNPIQLIAAGALLSRLEETPFLKMFGL